jgi:hypothetical protein
VCRVILTELNFPTKIAYLFLPLFRTPGSNSHEINFFKPGAGEVGQVSPLRLDLVTLIISYPEARCLRSINVIQVFDAFGIIQ